MKGKGTFAAGVLAIGVAASVQDREALEAYCMRLVERCALKLPRPIELPGGGEPVRMLRAPVLVTTTSSSFSAGAELGDSFDAVVTRRAGEAAESGYDIGYSDWSTSKK